METYHYIALGRMYEVAQEVFLPDLLPVLQEHCVLIDHRDIDPNRENRPG